MKTSTFCKTLNVPVCIYINYVCVYMGYFFMQSIVGLKFDYNVYYNTLLSRSCALELYNKYAQMYSTVCLANGESICH